MSSQRLNQSHLTPMQGPLGRRPNAVPLDLSLACQTKAVTKRERTTSTSNALQQRSKQPRIDTALATSGRPASYAESVVQGRNKTRQVIDLTITDDEASDQSDDNSNSIITTTLEDVSKRRGLPEAHDRNQAKSVTKRERSSIVVEPGSSRSRRGSVVDLTSDNAPENSLPNGLPVVHLSDDAEDAPMVGHSSITSAAQASAPTFASTSSLQPVGAPAATPSRPSTKRPTNAPSTFSSSVKNINRRAETVNRRNAANSSSADARLVELAALLEEVMANHLARGSASQSIPSHPTFEQLISKANFYFNLRSEQPLTDSLFNDTVKHDQHLCDFLYSLSTTPLTTDYAAAIAAGVLSPEPLPLTNDDNQVNFYMRVDHFDCPETMKRHLETYKKRRGDPFLPAILEHELGSARTDQGMALAYAGVAVDGDSFSREAEDRQSTEADQCRRGRWTEGRTLSIYNIPCLSQMVSSPFEWRYNKSLAALERLLIGCLGSCSLNSASGGFHPQPKLNAATADAAATASRPPPWTTLDKSATLAAFDVASELEERSASAHHLASIPLLTRCHTLEL